MIFLEIIYRVVRILFDQYKKWNIRSFILF